MPYAKAKDGTKLYYEEAGTGTPVIFVHEYAGDYRSWEPQMRYLSRLYRCITFSQRGYPPSDVPTADDAYLQPVFRDDVIAVLNHLKIDKAHVVGHSMGASTVLHVGLDYASRCHSITLAGCGWGSDPNGRENAVKMATEIAEMFRKEGIEKAANTYANFGMRHQYKAKDPRGWAEFEHWMSEHSAEGHALTMLNLQIKRATLYELADRLPGISLPTLVITGDEDESCLDGSVFLKRKIPTAGLMVIPRAGHTINSEEPAAFNQALLELFTAAEAGRWMSHRLDASAVAAPLAKK